MRHVDQPKTAGIITSFNQARYIEESVRTLACQVDELIVIDDCSTDGSSERVLDIRLRNVRLVSTPERSGVSRACNLAVEMTNAEIIVLQGGDDRSLPGRVARHILDLDDARTIVSASIPSIINSEGQALSPVVAAEFVMSDLNEDPLHRLVFDGNFICAPTVAMRRSDYRGLGGFPLSVDLLQDYALWLRALAVGSLAVSTRTFVEYRKHGTNTSRSHVGLDAPRIRRHAAELESIVTSFIESSSDEVLNRLGAGAGLGVIAADASSRLAARAMLLLNHPNRTIRRRGLNLLFSLATESGSWETMKSFLIERDDFEIFAQDVDHENRAEMSRLLWATAQIEEIGCEGL